MSKKTKTIIFRRLIELTVIAMAASTLIGAAAIR